MSRAREQGGLWLLYPRWSGRVLMVLMGDAGAESQQGRPGDRDDLLREEGRLVE